MSSNYNKNRGLFYFVCILFGLGMGIYLGSYFFSAWNRQVDIHLPNIYIGRVMTGFIGIVSGIYISYKLENKYLHSKYSFLYIIFSFLLIIITIYILGTILMVTTKIIIIFVSLLIILFAIGIYSIFKFFHDDY